MSGDLFAVAGKKIFIGPAIANKAANFVAADFASLTFTEIDGWESHGAFGDNAATITTALINRNRDIKQKGTSNAGQMQNQFAIARTDPGQIALRAAQKSNSNFAFKVQDTDVPAGGGTPTVMYFIALVMNASEQGGTANTVQMLQGTLEINSNIVIVDAATA